jgi:hypothetical protein
MTTEVQIGRNRTHLHMLGKVVSRTATWLGISRKDSQDMQEAVSQACLMAMGESSDDTTTPLKVRVSADAISVTVDITDQSVGYVPLHMAEYADDGSGTMAKIGSLVDSVELISGDNSATIRITTQARKIAASAATTASYLSTSLQS